jgi:hypothetical protein
LRLTAALGLFMARFVRIAPCPGRFPALTLPAE